MRGWAAMSSRSCSGSIKQPSDVIALADRICEATNAPFDLDGHQVVVGVSIGIAIAPTDAVDADQLLKNADMALYRAKAEGRGAYRFFEPEMDALMQARRVLEVDLRKALVNGEFEVYYQPIVDLENQAVTGCRSPRTLEPSRTRAGRAVGIHPAGGRNRLDRADRRMGASRRRAAKRRNGRAISPWRSTFHPRSSRCAIFHKS